LEGSKLSIGVFKMREPERSIKPKRAKGSGLDLTIWVAMRSTAFFVGSTHWSVGTRPRGFVGKRKSGRRDSKGSFDHEEGEML
jgi:hypothetical protein